LLARTGTSGTACGFTGEQHDEATGLLFLRARYYNPALRAFMGNDGGGVGRRKTVRFGLQIWKMFTI
jgi:RHS repeat-associated protein